MIFSDAHITAEDLANYQVEIHEGMQTKLANGLVVCGPPPPSSAAVTQAILNILSGMDLDTIKKNIAVLFMLLGYHDLSDSAETFHRFIEATKFAYADRSELGDPNFVEKSFEACTTYMILVFFYLYQQYICQFSWQKTSQLLIMPTLFGAKSPDDIRRSEKTHSFS